MRDIVRLPIAAAGTIALASIWIGAAAAADLPFAPQPQAPYPQAQVQPPPDYYPPPPPAQGYAYPPPVAYEYPPPPAAYYEYQAPPVVVVQRPYYWRRPFGPVYGERVYGARPYGAYVARGYGHFDRPHRGW